MPTERTGPVIVVGGGVVGTSVAYFLRDADRSVYLLEKDDVGSGTTAASIAQFIHHQERPTHEEYARRKRAWEWYGPRVESGALSFEQVGTLHLAAGDDGRGGLDGLANAHAAFGLDVDVFDSGDLAPLGLDPGRLRSGFLLPGDGYLDPRELVGHWADAAREAGVSVETGVEVTDVRTRHGAVTGVETTAGEYDAGTVVNAAGPWVRELDGMAGVSVPLRHTGGPVVVLEVDRSRSLPLTFFGNEVYLRSDGEGRVLAGKFATDYNSAEQVDPDGTFGVSGSFYEEVAETVERYAPGFEGYEWGEEWFGLRTVTPDGHPVVGRTSIDGYVVATGMSGYGVTLAPTVGQGVASLIETGKQPPSVAPLGPGRFG